MRRTNTSPLALLLAAFLLPACSRSSSGSGASNQEPPPTPAPSPVPAPAAPPSSASMTVLDQAGRAGPFALADLDKLVVVVDASHFRPGQHAVRVDVTAPAGTLYAQLPATLAVGNDGAGRASAALQVRGSLIESFHDVGTWQLLAHIDGAPVASASVDVGK